MNKFINYLRFSGIFLILELFITFIVSILSLLGLNSGITSIIMFISNIIIFFILTFFNAVKLKKKGLIEGLILGAIFIVLMLIINIILFRSHLRISTIIYYIILLIVSMLGGMIGVNKKSE